MPRGRARTHVPPSTVAESSDLRGQRAETASLGSPGVIALFVGPRARLLGLLVVSVGQLLFTAAASATPVPFTLHLTGSMETITFDAAAAGLEQGDRFDLGLTLDPGAVTDAFESPVPSLPDTMLYFGGVAGLEGTLAGVDLALGAPLAPGPRNPAEVSYRRGDSSAPDRHIVQFGPTLDSAFGTSRLTRLLIGFLDEDGAFLDSTEFTGDPFVPGFLDTLEQATVQFEFTTTLADGTVRRSNPLGRLDQAVLAQAAPVPVPGSAWLVLTMLAALVAARGSLRARAS